MFGRIWDVTFVICLLLLIAEADSFTEDELPPPENLNLSWNPDHSSVTAEWSEPAGLDADCKVNYTAELHFKKCLPSSTEPNPLAEKRRTKHLKENWKVSNEREICVIVRTNPMECGNMKPSKSIYQNISPPLALVKNFTCVYYSHEKMNCTWRLISNASDLQLYYRNKESGILKACGSYFTNGPMMMGCHLNDIDFGAHETFFMINGTMKGSTIPNNFIIAPRDSVKPERPKLNIIRNGSRLCLLSDAPNFSTHCWKYRFKYRKCNEEREVPSLEPTLTLDYDSACPYSAQVQSIFTQNCGVERQSEMSEPVYLDKSIDLNMAVIIAPIAVSCCLILALVLFRRYKDIFLPEIPAPSLIYFKDMLNGNNDGGQSKSLYVPTTEVVERDVKLEPSSTFLISKP
ncbi:granulocyte-macrophage colony-stimulating factor receptor subunit alpha-like [Hoplias malabaricus]|uniref:granulocyte-macrophage colony-stimulating factor receptor subunit alpha-like n=1 Tax=Hoplias malabaricus TaxID=27720 RepID=UPI0034619488